MVRNDPTPVLKRSGYAGEKFVATSGAMRGTIVIGRMVQLMNCDGSVRVRHDAVRPVTTRSPAVLAAAALLLAPLPALADRHCYPALDSYFAARAAAIDPDRACAEAWAGAAEALGYATTNAQICGCAPLIAGLEGLGDALPEGDLSCDDALARIRDAADAIKDHVTACHR